MSRTRLLRSRRVLFGLAVSVIFLVLLLWQVDLSEIGMALREAQPGWIVAAAPIYLLGLWLRAWRWQLVLRPTLSISTGDAFSMMMVGFAANNLLPVRAGEVVRAGMLRQAHGVGWTVGFGTIIVERVLDGLVLTTFLAVTIALAGGTALLTSLALLATAIGLGGTVVLAALAWRLEASMRLVTRLLRFAPARFRPRLRAWTGGFISGMTTLRGFRAWSVVTLATTLSWVAEAVGYWFVGLAFGLNVPALVYAGALGAANLALAVPATAGGVGPYEFFTREVVVAHGATVAAGTAYAFALHALIVAPLIMIGLLVLWRRRLGLHALLGPHDDDEQATAPSDTAATAQPGERS
jgi:uncharacterized protein (TIRG00374 family)